MPSATTELPLIAEHLVAEALAGVGGMGTVYRARDTRMGRTVAVKLLQPSDNPRDGERFAREAQILFELRHPGIVEYLEHGVTGDGRPYLAMEWLSGEDLTHRLTRGPLSLAEGLSLARRTAEALSAAHRRNIVHRDLKPSNLFLRDGAVNRVALLDFGIARRRAFAPAITGTGVIVGTPAYMAPEQARAERDLTPAVDVFSLGCVLFECLTGEPPFMAEQLMAILAKILFAEPPKLRFVRPDLPEAVEALLVRMLAKNPATRLADASAVLAALDAVDAALARTTDATLAMPAPRVGLAGNEQQLVSVLIATHDAAAGEAIPTTGERQGLARALEVYGAHVELLADGSLVATLIDAHGRATDQAAQAARCALLIKAGWPEAGIALCTGRGLLRERLPIGEVLDRATLLLRDHAHPSEQILLDEVTQGLLDIRFRRTQTPSGAYALLGEELTLDASRPLLGKPTPCVGREADLGALELMLSGCIEDAVPCAVLVTAPPGAGKSRLRHEFLRRVEAQSQGGRCAVQVLLGRGDPMSAGSAYGLLGQAVRRLASILDGEGLELSREKLAKRVAERLPDAEKERVVAFLGELAGVPFPDEDHVKLRAARQDPLIMGDQIALAWIDFLRAECEGRPLLLVLEDLHWGDALTVKLVSAALRELGERPLMVLALARPEVEGLLPPSWAGVAQAMLLRPLSRKAGERLVREVLGASTPRETVARIVERSAGNALFLEELIRSEAEGRGDHAPETVLAILQARIGRLDGGSRRVLRAASVFGDTSWLGGIHAILGPTHAAPEIEDKLRSLLAEEILEERRESRFSGERELRFHHALMRDAAYGLLTDDDRAEGHRAAARYLEARGEPDAVVLAEHFEKGNEQERAIPYYLQAAEQLHETNQMNAAFACAERGLGCGARGEPRGALLSITVAVYHGRDQYAEALAAGREAIDLLPEGSRRWCRTFHTLFVACLVTQQVALFTEISARFGGIEPLAEARGEYVMAAAWLAIALCLMGQKAASRAFSTHMREICAEIDRREVAWGYLWSVEANDHHVLEEAPWSAMVSNAAAREALSRAGDQRNCAIIDSYYGKALYELGDHAAAESALRKDLATAAQLNEPHSLAYLKTYLARLLAGAAPLAELDEPARLARDVIAAKNLSLVGVAYGVLAEIARRRGDLVGAEAEARLACESARPFPTYSWDLVALHARILLEQGRADEALAPGEEAVSELERLGVAGCGEIPLRLAVAESLDAVGRVEAAREALADVLQRLWLRVRNIPEAAARERYLTKVPTNARLLLLGRAWLGDAAATPPDF